MHQQLPRLAALRLYQFGSLDHLDPLPVCVRWMAVMWGIYSITVICLMLLADAWWHYHNDD